jgi:hypothetical protein
MSHQLLTLPRTNDASPLRGTDQARKPARRRQCGRVFPTRNEPAPSGAMRTARGPRCPELN